MEVQDISNCNKHEWVKFLYAAIQILLLLWNLKLLCVRNYYIRIYKLDRIRHPVFLLFYLSDLSDCCKVAWERYKRYIIESICRKNDSFLQKIRIAIKAVYEPPLCNCFNLIIWSPQHIKSVSKKDIFLTLIFTTIWYCYHCNQDKIAL